VGQSNNRAQNFDEHEKNVESAVKTFDVSAKLLNFNNKNILDSLLCNVDFVESSAGRCH
jgi:hypothetical protein